MSRFISYLNSCSCRLPSKEKLKETEEEKETEKEFSQDYLTFEALEDGTFTFTNAINYSIDGGTTWIELAANTNTPTIVSGNKIMWKATLTSSHYYGIGTFISTGNFNVEGNPMSLLFGDNFIGQTDLTGKNYTFCRLFDNCSKLISAENLSLPATTLAAYCYYNMFQGCTSLTTAPELPATTLMNYCYATMFYNCTNLNYIKAMFTTTPSSSYTGSWVSGVAATGTFVKNSAATWNVSGVNGVPTGWTVQTASA